MQGISLIKSILITFLLLTASTWAQPFQDVEARKFVRCFGQFVGDVPSQDDPIMKAIKAKEMTGTEGCMMLLEFAELQENGEIQKQGDNYHPIGMKVIKRFDDFHRTWFSNYRWMDLESGITKNNNNVIEYGQGALYLTRALFQKDKNYSSIVTDDVHPRAIRYSKYEEFNGRPSFEYLTITTHVRRPTWMNLLVGTHYDLNAPVIGGVNEIETDTTLPRTEMGLLVGVVDQPQVVLDDPLTFAEGIKADRLKVDGESTLDNLDIFQHGGGGILGSQAYLLLNHGQSTYLHMDGGAYMPRRWVKNLFEDVLCRQLPALRAIDAGPYVNKESNEDGSLKNSNLPFRDGLSCMQCHTTMENGARTARNIMHHFSGIGLTKNLGHGLSFIHHKKIVFDSDAVPNNRDYIKDWNTGAPHQVTYSYSPPEGRLIFRSFTGELIKQDTDGIGGLGAAIAETPDLYACAVKRYTQFLTGVEIPLYDYGNLAKPQLTSQQQGQVDFLKKLTFELKDHQDPTKTIRAIIDSPYYMNPNYTGGTP